MARFPVYRPRRLRRTERLRTMVRETSVSAADFIAPMFVTVGSGVRAEISSMPGQFRFSVDTAVQTAKRWADAGIRAVLLFGIPAEKDAEGTGAYDDGGPVQELTRALKSQVPGLTVMTDVCLCDYTDHGHCGLLAPTPAGGQDVDNDRTLDVLGRVAAKRKGRRGVFLICRGAIREPKKKQDRAKEGEPFRFQVDLLIEAEAHSLVAKRTGVKKKRPWKREFEVTYITPRQIDLPPGQKPESDRQALQRACEKFAKEFFKYREDWMKL